MREDKPAWRRIAIGGVSLAVAGVIWLPCIHLFFRQDVDDYFCVEGIPPKAGALVARHLELWSEPELREKEIGKMRTSNAEWDFMARTFFVLSLANMGFRNPEAG